MVQPRLTRFRDMALDQFTDWFSGYQKKEVLNKEAFSASGI